MVPRLGIGSLLLIAGLRGASRDSPLIDQSPVAITGVTVVDVASGGLLPNETVIIDGGKIIAMGPATSTPPPSGSRRVDGTGKYLIPGLWDMHTHLTMTGRSALKLFLANGVTGVRDMGGDPGVVLPWRDSIAAGSLEGPRILAAGSIVESASWLNAVLRLAEQLHSPELEAELRLRLPIETTTDGIRDVDSLVALRADFLKIRNFPSPAAYWALARAARGHGLRITGHSPPASELGPVSDSGFASFEHSIISVRNDTLIDAFDGMTESQRGELFHRFAKNGTAYDPTLVSSKARFVPDSAISRMIGDSAGASVPTLRYVSGAIRMAWRTQLAMRAVEGDNNWGPIYRSNLRDIREMAAAGVLILAGTDTIRGISTGFWPMRGDLLARP